jgi:GNAT superfamily N-acetyltransferase
VPSHSIRVTVTLTSTLCAQHDWPRSPGRPLGRGRFPARHDHNQAHIARRDGHREGCWRPVPAAPGPGGCFAARLGLAEPYARCVQTSRSWLVPRGRAPWVRRAPQAVAGSGRAAARRRPLLRHCQEGFLAFAAVFPHARGLGAGRALGEAVIAWAAQAGYDCMVTDCRVTNLLSSRTWPRLGFAASFLRLHRLVGY